MSFQFKSTDNMMTSPEWEMVMAPDHVQQTIVSLMAHCNATTADEVKNHSKDARLMMQALEHIQNLPLRPIEKCNPNNPNYSYRRHYKKKYEDLVHVVGGAERFRAEFKLDKVNDISEDEFKKTWEHLSVIRLGLKRMWGSVPNTGGWMEFAIKNTERADRIKKRVDKNDVMFETLTDSITQNFVQSHGVALFVSKKKGLGPKVDEGFLGAKDDMVPLVRARLFDSEEAAHVFLRRKTIKDYYDSFQVVKINIQTEGLGKLIEGASEGIPDNANVLHELVAKIQKEQIEQALYGASRERLLARLEELEGQQNIQSQTEPPKRKM